MVLPSTCQCLLLWKPSSLEASLSLLIPLGMPCKHILNGLSNTLMAMKIFCKEIATQSTKSTTRVMATLENFRFESHQKGIQEIIENEKIV